MKRMLIGILVLAVVGGALGAAVAPPAAAEDNGWELSYDPPRQARADDKRADAEKASRIVIARTANLIHRPDGMPATGQAARRFVSAKVKQDLDRRRVSGTFRLGAAPTAGSNAHLHVAFGYLDGYACNADVQFSSQTHAPNGGFSRSGATISFNRAYSDAGWKGWDCAFAALTGADHAPSFDALINQLSDVHAKPDLRIASVKLLGKKKIKLVRGVKTVLEVRIRNASRADAPGTVLKGRGKGIKVANRRVGKIWGDGATTVRVTVKLKKKRRTKIKLLATTTGDKTTKKVKVKPRKAPKRAKNGKYRSKNGRVTFRIRNNRVVGLRGRMYTRCGGYPNFPTYTWNYYNYPKVKIPRNGIVDRRHSGKRYTVGLQMFVNGGKVKQGRFWYSGPNRCFAVETFRMRRR